VKLEVFRTRHSREEKPKTAADLSADLIDFGDDAVALPDRGENIFDAIARRRGAAPAAEERKPPTAGPFDAMKATPLHGRMGRKHYSADDDGAVTLLFGKHNGERVADIETGYLQWILEAQRGEGGFPAAIVEAVEAEIARRVAGR